MTAVPPQRDRAARVLHTPADEDEDKDEDKDEDGAPIASARPMSVASLLSAGRGWPCSRTSDFGLRTAVRQERGSPEPGAS